MGMKLTARTALGAAMLALSCFGVAAALGASAKTTTEYWELTITLRVPRVYDNTQSRGYRKYQTQRLQGYFTVTPADAGEPKIAFYSLENRTHKIGGQRVTYDVELGYCLWHGIGSNLSRVFKTRSVVLNMAAEPSYVRGYEPSDDNSLVLTLAGKSPKGKQSKIKGYVAGQLGCGCAAYGHVSPTRIWGSGTVVDTAAVFGTWTAKRMK